MKNAKRLIAVLLVMACAAWAQASAAQTPAKSAPPATKPKVAAKPQAAASKSASAAAQSKPAASTGKRDPFVSLAVVRAQQIGAACGTGKRCLVIDQVELKGVVKTPRGMIAMVENPAKKAYFLRENDPVYNGYVVKITGDSVIFKETSVDNQGRTQTRDVVKRVSAPAV
jgi:Tfp pilus assembly protein PilP